jgi:MFS family permease
MATNIPSSRSSTVADENVDDKADPVPYENGDKHSIERPSLERIGSQNKETEANIFPEPEAAAEADLEKAGVIPKSVVPPGGVNPADFPDGGTEAWLVVLGGWCCLFVSFGWINCIGVFQEYYQENLLRGYSSSTVSWIPSLELFMMFFGGPFFGKTFDNFGPRGLLAAGSVLHVLGLMMTSLSTKYYQILLAQGVCSALGASAIFFAAMSSTSTWFFKKRATAIGIIASGSSMGGVIFPIMVAKLIPRIGFPWTMRSTAFMILGMCALANLTVKSRLTPRRKKVDVMEFLRPLKEPAFAITCIAAFLFFFGTFLPFNYVILQSVNPLIHSTCTRLT